MKKNIFKNYSTIFWDFDGVIMDSNEIRDRGFEKVLRDFPDEEVEKLMKFHKENGGLSRYVKFRHFFENIRNRGITEEEINEWAESFSQIMRELLIDYTLLIDETLCCIKEVYQEKNMHIVSGSDQEELRFICNHLDISRYFDSINGSPIPKVEHVKSLIERSNYVLDKCVLIGDSINDYEAARDNGINFISYNNKELEIRN